MYNVDLITFVMKASISSSHFEHDLLVKKKTILVVRIVNLNHVAA